MSVYMLMHYCEPDVKLQWSTDILGLVSSWVRCNNTLESADHSAKVHNYMPYLSLFYYVNTFIAHVLQLITLINIKLITFIGRLILKLTSHWRQFLLHVTLHSFIVFNSIFQHQQMHHCLFYRIQKVIIILLAMKECTVHIPH